MAKQDKQAQANAGKIDPAVANLAQFLPEGFKLEDFDVVGGLRPIITPELNQGTPIAGYIVALLDMPPREDGSKWKAILVNLLSPAKAKAGDEVISIEPGKDVLVPVGGNLGNNADLLNAASSVKQVFLGIFHVTGTLPTGKPSEMWVYEVRIAKGKAIPRTGQFALYNREPAASLPAGPAPGTDIRTADGKPAGSLVGNAQA
jgi:hypothetical protein